MKKNNNSKYYVIIGVFAVIFLIVFCVSMGVISEYLEYREYDTVAYRLKSLDYCVDDNRGISTTLRMDKDFEDDFDEYWEYADIEYSYLQGILLKRAIEDGDDSLEDELEEHEEKINNFIDETQNYWMKEKAAGYLEALDY